MSLSSLPLEIQNIVISLICHHSTVLNLRLSSKHFYDLCLNYVIIAIAPKRISINESVMFNLLCSIYSPDLVSKVDFHNCEISNFNFINALPDTVRTLEIAQGHNIPSGFIPLLPPRLENLNLSSNKYLCEIDLTNLPHNLRYLNLSFCPSLTDDHMQYLPRTLQSIDLSFCPQITNAGLSKLPATIQTLRFLCNHTSNIGIVNLAHLKMLNSLYITYMGNIVFDGKHLPDCIQQLFIMDICFAVGTQPPSTKVFPSRLTDVLIPWPITPEELKALPTKTIKKIHLESYRELRNIRAFTEFSSLEVLSLGKEACDIHLDSLPKSLKTLRLRGCPEVSDHALARLPHQVEVWDFRYII